MKKILYTIILLILFTASPLFAQTFKIEIPYRSIAGKLVLEMKVGGTPQHLVLDTGGRTAFLESWAKEHRLTAGDTLRVTDVNGNSEAYRQIVVNSISTIDDKVNFTDIPALLLPEDPGLSCLNAIGIIGSDMLVDKLLIIDSQKKLITIASAITAPNVSLRRMIDFVQPGMPIITLQIGTGTFIRALFDTGSPQLLSLSASDYDDIKDSRTVCLMAQGKGESNIGISGRGEYTNMERMNIPLLSVGATKFYDVVTTTAQLPISLLGTCLLDYGRVTIDYKRNRFYLEPYKPDKKIKFKKKYNDFALTIDKDGNLIIANVWDKLYNLIDVGDKVIEINGKPTQKYDFCESLVNGIPELKKRKKSTLTVATQNGEKYVTYIRQ